MSDSSCVRLMVIGAGNRGEVYSQYAIDFPTEASVVAIVDPHKTRQRNLGRIHSVPQQHQFESCPCRDNDVWNQVDAVIVAVPDALHCEIVLLVLERGIRYVLLEKPMGINRQQCQDIVEATIRANACVAVCHVLRYTPMNRQVKTLMDSGVLGDVLNVQHTEPVGYYHFAHSYVRGNWRRTSKSACSLLTKSCHDVDLISYWMNHTKVVSVSSFGSRRHFRKERKPSEARQAKKCLDCPYESQCPYSAKKIYLNAFFENRGVVGWPVSVVLEGKEATLKNVKQALDTGPYGQCVYECDNDVCDNQVVNFQFENGSTATFTMIATTERLCTRQTKVYGSRGELTAHGETNTIEVFDFLTQTRQTYEPKEHDIRGSAMGGHGYADYHLMNAFVRAVSNKDPSLITTSASESLKSHSLVFDAEESRLKSIQGKLFSW